MYYLAAPEHFDGTMPEFGITEAQIVGLFMESVFYGVSDVVFYVDGRLSTSLS